MKYRQFESNQKLAADPGFSVKRRAPIFNRRTPMKIARKAHEIKKTLSRPKKIRLNEQSPFLDLQRCITGRCECRKPQKPLMGSLEGNYI